MVAIETQPVQIFERQPIAFEYFGPDKKTARKTGQTISRIIAMKRRQRSIRNPNNSAVAEAVGKLAAKQGVEGSIIGKMIAIDIQGNRRENNQAMRRLANRIYFR